MSAAFVRNAYGIPYKTGDVVMVDGRRGIIMSFPGQYLGVRFDTDGAPASDWIHSGRVERTDVRRAIAEALGVEP